MITKLLYLIFVKLKNMVAKDLFFFLILSVGVMTCNLMFVFGYGIIMQINERDGMDDFYLYNKNTGMGIVDIENGLRKFSAEIYYYLPVEKDNCSELITKDPNGYVRYIRTSRSIFQTNVMNGNINDLDQLGTVIVPANIKDLRIGSTIILNGNDYLIVGSSVSDDLRFP